MDDWGIPSLSVLKWKEEQKKKAVKGSYQKYVNSFLFVDSFWFIKSKCFILSCGFNESY